MSAPAKARCEWCKRVAELTDGTCSDGCALAASIPQPSALSGTVLSAFLVGLICGLPCALSILRWLAAAKGIHG